MTSRMASRFLLPSLLIVAALSSAAPVGAQQYIELGPGTWCNDITPDGEVVVGTAPLGCFIWRWRVDPSPTFINGADAVAVSDDGTVMTGNMADPMTGNQVAGRWTQATGWVPIGGISTCGSISSAYDITGDGSSIVGFVWVNGCDAHGFRWTDGVGIEVLDSLGNGTNRCSAISADGAIMGGFAQGSQNRTPSVWLPDLTGQLYNIDWIGEVYGFSEDGSIILGAANGNAFSQAGLGGPLTNLGKLNTGVQWTGIPEDVTSDGQTIAGFDVAGLAREAWVWTASDGIISMNDRLTALGINGVGALLTTRAVSEDGNVVVGGGAGTGGPFDFVGYIAELGTNEGPFEDVGGGTTGIAGAPTLDAAGTLQPHSAFTMGLTNAPANALMLAWVSLSSTPFNAFGGTIHAFPNATNIFLNADGSGEFNAATTWPVGIPAGTELWFQFIVADASVFWGKTLSNALKATTP